MEENFKLSSHKKSKLINLTNLLLIKSLNHDYILIYLTYSVDIQLTNQFFLFDSNIIEHYIDQCIYTVNMTYV